MTLAAILATLLVGHAATAGPALDVDVARYRAAPVATLTGRVYEERRRPDSADQPLVGTVITLVPRSVAFYRRLEDIERHARDSMAAYRASAPAIHRARDQYEQQLWEAGAADLVYVTTVDADGRFTFERVPEGEWLLIGWHATPVRRSGVPGRARDINRFRLQPGLEGYDEVSVWMKQLDLETGRGGQVELTDRNVWFSGVAEERTPDTGR